MNTRLAALLLLFSFSASADIVGTVTDVDGHPLQGVHITAERPKTLQQRLVSLTTNSTRSAIANVETTANGTFSIRITEQIDLVQVSLDHSGFVPVSIRLNAPADDAGTIVLTPVPSKRARISSGGQPVANARIVALSDYGSSATAMSDASGNYELPDPDVWASRLIVLTSDHAPLIQDRAPAARFQSVDHLDAGITLRGSVQDASGAPVRGASILIDGIPLTTSDQDGHWLIEHAPPAHRIMALTDDQAGIAAGADHRIILSAAHVIHGTVVDEITGRPVASMEIRQADENGAAMVSAFSHPDGTFQLPAVADELTLSGVRPGYRLADHASIRQPPHQYRAQPTTIIHGMVIDEHRSPVAASLVMAHGATSSPNGPPIAAYSGPDGRFVLREVATATRRIEATKRGYFSATRDLQTLGRDGAVLILTKGTDLRGVINDSQTLPIAGATIVARLSASNLPPLKSDAATSAQDGTFTIHLRPGVYDIGVAHEGFPTAWRKALHIDASTPLLQITMDRGVTQDGVVVKSDGTPAAGIYVGAFVEGPPVPPSQTDNAGHFRLPPLPAGKTMLRVGRAGNGFVMTREVAIPATDLTIVLPETSALRGHVIDADSGRPITKFTVDVLNPESKSRLLSPLPVESEDGRFEIPDAPSGHSRLVMRADSYAGVDRDIDTARDTDITVEMRHAFRLTGRVTDEHGEGIGGVRIVQHTAHPSLASPYATTSQSGDYSLPALPKGKTELRFEKSGYQAGFLDVELSADRDGADVLMKRGEQLSGVVLDEAGEPVAGALVDTAGAAAERTEEDGAFSISAANCPCSIRATKPGYVTAVQDGVTPSGASIQLRLRRGVAIEGHVSGLPATELAATHVAAMTATGLLSTQCDASGHYRIEGVPAGPVRATAQLTFGDDTRSTEEVMLDVHESDLHYDFVFAERAVITGTVRNHGKALANAHLSFHPKSDRRLSYASTMTSADGSYRIVGLGSGQYEVLIDAETMHEARTLFVSGSSRFDVELGN